MGAPRNIWRLPMLFAVAAVACCDCSAQGTTPISLADGERLELIFAKDNRLPPNRIEVCLVDKTPGPSALAFDLASINPPRWKARRGNRACANFAKVKQIFQFWKIGHDARPVIKLRAPINLDTPGANRLSLLWRGKRR